MINLCNFLLRNDRIQATPVEIGTTINPTPVTDNATDVVLAPIITIVSTDCKTVLRVL